MLITVVVSQDRSLQIEMTHHVGMTLEGETGWSLMKALVAEIFSSVEHCTQERVLDNCISLLQCIPGERSSSQQSFTWQMVLKWQATQ